MDSVSPAIVQRAMRVMRQALFRQIHFLDPAVRNAVFYLSTKAKGDPAEYTAKLDKIAQEHYEQLDKIIEQFGCDQTEAIKITLTGDYIENSLMTPKMRFILTRGNTYKKVVHE